MNIMVESPAKKKTDLSAFKRAGAADQPLVLSQPQPQPQPAPAVRGRVGRTPKTPDEKRAEKVTLSLTPAEREALRRKAGLVPEATYLMDQLRKIGLFD